MGNIWLDIYKQLPIQNPANVNCMPKKKEICKRNSLWWNFCWLWKRLRELYTCYSPIATFSNSNIFWPTVLPGCFSTGLCWYHPTAQLHHGFLRKALGDFVTPFVLESCLIIHVLLNLQVHTWGISLAACRFWKVCLGLNIFHRSIVEEIDLLWM